MMDKLQWLLRRFTKTTPKDTYLKLLEQFDSSDNSIATLPTMLVEFWRRVDLKDFEDAVSYKDLMYTRSSVRHNTLAELISIMTLATAAIVHDDDSTIKDISINQFAVNTLITLDDYLVSSGNRSVDYYTCVKQLKELVLAHGDVIDNITSSYYTRSLNRMYNDLLTITTVIINQLKG